MQEEYILSLENCYLEFKENDGQISKIIEDFSINLPHKGKISIIGKSGKGKTTVLNLIAGLIVPQKGKRILKGNTKIAYVFQDERLIPWLSALKNIELVLPRNQKQNAENWLKEVGLENEALKKTCKLSGGMRKRLALAKALAFKGDILLLDEPFSGLDGETQKFMIKVIDKHTRNILTLLVTHDLVLAKSFAQKIYKI